MAIDPNSSPIEDQEGIPKLNQEPAIQDEVVIEEYLILTQHQEEIHVQQDKVEGIFDLNMQAGEDQRIPDLNLQPTVGDEDAIQEDEQVPAIQLEDIPDEDLDAYADHVNIIFDVDELNSSSDDSDYEPVHIIRRRHYLSDEQRQDIYEALLEKSVNEKLDRTATGIVATMFNVRRRVVQDLWTKVKKCHAAGIAVDIKSKKRMKCGRKKVAIDFSQIETIPLNRRTTIRSLADAMNVPKSTIYKAFQERQLRRHSNTLKSYLKDDNKKHRLQFSLSMLDQQTLNTQPSFTDMRNIVHIDEKWFNSTKKIKTFYMGCNEVDPERIVQNKKAIEKVMFLTAVARPRYDEEGHCYFDGKIGIWPFVKKEPAQRASRNRPRGTLITKSLTVSTETSRSFLITKVIPTIVSCWPEEDVGEIIWIQQGNARIHIIEDDAEFALAVAEIGLDIRIKNQPPNSLDMNVLDLGFFASLQSMIYLTNSTTMDDIIDNVESEYSQYDEDLVNRVFLTLQSCFIEVMNVGGGNGYKIPHMNKERLERIGMLPTRLTCDLQIYQRAMQSLS